MKNDDTQHNQKRDSVYYTRLAISQGDTALGELMASVDPANYADLVPAKAPAEPRQPAAKPQESADNSIVEQLVATRIQQGIPQLVLAERVGMKQSSLARVESGTSNPTLQTLQRIADALDVRLTLQPKR